ncbi:MAG: hypothetical protein E2P00_00675, partial [Acidobacteria bacterium]
MFHESPIMLALGEMVLMRVRSALVFTCALLPVLSLAGETRSQAVDDFSGCNAAVTGSPRLSPAPEQSLQDPRTDAWGKILDQVRASRYNLSRRQGTDGDAGDFDSPEGTNDAIWVAAHPKLNLEYEFGAGGMRVQPRRGKQDTWNWGLLLVGFGGEGGLQATELVSPHVRGNRVEYRRPGLLEWYIHDRRGVEQGFTIETIPEGAGDRMRV